MLKFFKILKTVSKDHPEGSVVQLLCDNKGVPIDPFWNQRFRDSKTDNCMKPVEIERPIEDFKKIEKKTPIKKGSKK